MVLYDLFCCGVAQLVENELNAVFLIVLCFGTRAADVFSFLKHLLVALRVSKSRLEVLDREAGLPPDPALYNQVEDTAHYFLVVDLLGDVTEGEQCIWQLPGGFLKCLPVPSSALGIFTS